MRVRTKHRSCRHTALKLFLIVLVACASATTSVAKEDISLQLKWRHAFQFAGYYMALEKGYYDEAGLSVTILEGGPDHSPLNHVLQGEGHYAISDSGLLVARAKGQPVKVLAAIFQHSPLALAVKKSSGIRSFQGLRGKRIMMQRDEMDAAIIAALHKAGLSDDDFIRQNTSFNLDDLIEGNTDAFSVYITDQPHQLKERGIRYRLLEPIQLDIDFYGDLLFTSERETKRNPARTSAFIDASLKGWHYALEHVDETINMLRKKYNTQGLSLRQLHFEASKTADMVLKNEVELGYISEFRWQQIANTYIDLGLIPENFELKDFIYHPAPSLQEVVKNYQWQLIISALLFLLLIFGIQSFILRKMVRSRTRQLRESKSLQMDVGRVLEMIATNVEINKILLEIIGIFENRHPDIHASILFIRKNRMWLGAAPSLPDEYNQAIEGLEIGPHVGSCGAAAYTKKRHIAEDLAIDPNWAAYTALTQPLGLRSCWSEPIINMSGNVIGTFAMYSTRPHSPDNNEISDIEQAAKLAGIAMERDNRFAELHKLSSAIEQAGEVITITDNRGIIEYTNPAFTRLTGYKASEAIGKTPRFIRDESRYREIEQKLKIHGVWQGKVIETRKDGSFYPAMLSISPIRDESGEIVHFVGVHEDLSEMEKMEERFQQAQKMEAIGTLVGGIAHDFNNMLAGITGNLFLLKRDTAIQEDSLERIGRIEKLTGHAAEMIKQMLTFASKGHIEKSDLPLSPFIRESMRLHRVSIPENIELSMDVDEDIYVHADATQLQQVLLNLLTNARDAVKDIDSPRIGIKLETIQADSVFIEKHGESRHQYYAHLSISDNGHGISPAIIQNIYEPFFTTKGVGKGTGLGLSMVFGSVQSHEGIIDLESSQSGTTFHIYLPTIPTPKESGDVDRGTSISDGRGETILLVDDDPMLLEAHTEAITALGYRVMTARNGMEAFKTYRKESDQIDLIIMDMVMPKLGGKNAAEKIKGINPEAKIIFASGYDLENSLEFETPKPGQIILQKPFSIETLSRILQRQLKTTHRQRAKQGRTP